MFMRRPSFHATSGDTSCISSCVTVTSSAFQVSAGDLVLVEVHVISGCLGASNISDSAGDSFTLVWCEDGGTSHRQLNIFAAIGSAGSSSMTVTVNIPSGGTSLDIAGTSFSGARSATAIAHNHSETCTTSSYSLTGTTSFSNSLLYVGFGVTDCATGNPATYTPGAGQTNVFFHDNSVALIGQGADYAPTVTPGSYTVSGSWSKTEDWEAVQIEIASKK